MKIILLIPNIRKYLGHDDVFVESRDDARIFDTILAADCYSAYVELVYGVRCYAGLKGRE